MPNEKPLNVSLTKYAGETADAHRVTINNLELFFSYQTLVAFRPAAGGRVVVCENVWSNTTGRHLTAIDGGTRDKRLPRQEFLKALNAELGLDK